MKLRELAHCRTGDKGDNSNVAVIVYRPQDYLLIDSTSRASESGPNWAAASAAKSAVIACRVSGQSTSFCKVP